VKYNYQHDNKMPGSVNGGEFLDHISDKVVLIQILLHALVKQNIYN
jgi:hypothetical protein